MKIAMNFLCSSIRPLAALMLTVVLFTACKKDDSFDNIRTPAAGLMAFNLATDKPAVGLALSGSNFGNAALGFNNYTGAYLPIYVGSREVRSFEFDNGATIAISSGNFADSNYYSVFVLGANGNYRNLVVKDAVDSLSPVAGKAWVRYINAIADSSATPVITIGTGTDNVINTSAAFATVSSFTQVDAGLVNTAVNNGSSIAANRIITLEENKIYTVLFAGLPGATDMSRAVQIKFIQNGSVTP